jgi:hypothetical protein
MKLNNMRIPLILLILAGLVLGGCAKPPKEEMENAAAALTQAENDPDAVAYGSPSIARAREALTNMDAEAAAKRYDSAKTYAQEAISAAERAIAEGKIGAQRARAEAADMVEGVKDTLEETEKTVNAAKAADTIQLDFDTLTERFDSAKNMVDQAQNSLAEENYPDAIDKCQAARSLLSDITAMISREAIATSRKK